MRRLRLNQRIILVVLGLIALGLLIGGAAFQQRLRSIKQSLPITTVSQHRSLSGLLQELKELEVAFETANVAPSPERFDALSINLDSVFVLSNAFFLSINNTPQEKLIAFIEQELNEILIGIDVLTERRERFVQHQAEALLSRLHGASNALQNVYLEANQEAFISLSRQAGQIERLGLTETVTSILLALVILVLMFVLYLNFRSARMLSEARERVSILSSAVEQSPVSIMISDPAGRVEYINPRFSDVSGYSPEEVMKQDVDVISFPESSPEFFDRYKESIVEQGLWHGELKNCKKDGAEFWESVSVSPLYDDAEQVKYFIVLKEDITEKKETERALQEAMQDAELATRAKTDFLANMSHEIRTPMNAVLGFAELLERRVSDPVDKDYLKAITGGGKALLQIINDILDISKIEAGKMTVCYETFNLHRLVAELERLFSITVQRKNIGFSAVLDDDVPELIVLDEVRLRQVLFNLVGNAVKFTSQGSVAVHVTASPTRDCVEDFVDLKIVIKDSGIGIAPDQLETIFLSFEQQRGQKVKRFCGTGLGLTICRKLIEMMHGHIHVTSVLDKGSTFSVSLPAVEIGVNPGEFEASSGSGESRYHFVPGNILVADDIETNRALIKEYLRETSLTVYEAIHGEEVIELLGQYAFRFVFLDLRMPVMDGIACVQQIRRNPSWKDLPVVVLTASAMREQLEEIMQYDFNSYLRKPVSRASVLEALATYIPCEIEQVERPPDMESLEEQETVQNPAQLLSKLTELHHEWSEIKGKGDFQLVECFAAGLSSLAQEHHSGRLEDYAQRLTAGVTAFNIETVTALMNAYPVLLGEFKERVAADD